MSLVQAQIDPRVMRHQIEIQTHLGEVRLPWVRNRPLLDIIEPESRADAVDDARMRLELYRRECFRKDSFRFWRNARRTCPIYFMATLELINLTEWDNALVRRLVSKLYRELRLRRMVRFLFQDTWTKLDEETGEIVKGTEKPENTWDGDAWEMPNGGLVGLCLSPVIAFPVVWDINRALPGQYLRRVTWFNDKVEMFLYLAAHEMRHLWQFEHEKKMHQICRLLEIDDEADADIYALRVLSCYRQKPNDYVSQKP